MTEGAAIADVVLPAAQWDKRVDVIQMWIGRPTFLTKPLDLLEKPDRIWIFVDFARRMNDRDKEGNLNLPSADLEVIFEA